MLAFLDARDEIATFGARRRSSGVLVEWILDGSIRVLTIVYALNGVWRPTTKRLGSRVDALPRKRDQLAERIEDALTEPDPRSALLLATELQLDTVWLALSGPSVDRADVACRCGGSPADRLTPRCFRLLAAVALCRRSLRSPPQ